MVFPKSDTARIRWFSFRPRARYALAGILAACLTTLSAGEATLTVETAPEGVQVWLDGRYVGDAPIRRKPLTPGSYTLKLIDPVQRASLSEQIELTDGEHVAITRDVKPRFGSLRVHTKPAGAEVSISTSLGTTPVSNDFMMPGKYRLDIRTGSDTYEPVTEEVTVRPGETVTLTHELERRPVFTKKALIRLALGAGAIGGFVWALVEHGEAESKEQQAQTSGPEQYAGLMEERDAAAGWRTVGVVLGAACVIGFEIVAFF
ncbi:MAG: PEGA domain-containing protein [Chitinivibrionales bacterium]|nr:PEGA domain-containing protein [Chitinivibrionales bacterium]